MAGRKKPSGTKHGPYDDRGLAPLQAQAYDKIGAYLAINGGAVLAASRKIFGPDKATNYGQYYYKAKAKLAGRGEPSVITYPAARHEEPFKSPKTFRKTKAASANLSTSTMVMVAMVPMSSLKELFNQGEG